MAIVRRRNEILRVDDGQVNYYMTIGYDVIDERGAVLKKAIPTDNSQLKAEYSRQLAEIETLKARIADLEKQLEEIKAKEKPVVKKTKKTADTADEA